jgi:hypothetical protein
MSHAYEQPYQEELVEAPPAVWPDPASVGAGYFVDAMQAATSSHPAAANRSPIITGAKRGRAVAATEEPAPASGEPQASKAARKASERPLLLASLSSAAGSDKAGATLPDLSSLSASSKRKNSSLLQPVPATARGGGVSIGRRGHGLHSHEMGAAVADPDADALAAATERPLSAGETQSPTAACRLRACNVVSPSSSAKPTSLRLCLRFCCSHPSSTVGRRHTYTTHWASTASSACIGCCLRAA